MDLLVKVVKVSYKRNVLEIMHDHSKDSGVLEEDKIRAQDPLGKSDIVKGDDDREQLKIGDRESEDTMEEENENSSSFIFRVSNSIDDFEGKTS